MAGSNYLDVLMAQRGGSGSFVGDVAAINDATAKRKREAAADLLLRSTMEKANQEAEQARIDETLAGVEADKRDALREQVAKTPNAVVVNGAVYSGANAGQKAHEDMLRKSARDKVVEQNQDKLDLLTLERDRQLKEISDKKKNFASGLKDYGMDEGDITPEMVNVAQANLDKAAADIEAKYQQSLAASKQPGAVADPSAAKQLESLKAQRDQVKDLSDKLRGVSESYGTATKAFEQGVDLESKDLLEQMLVDNPFQAPSDPRRFDRFREQSIQRSMPDLLTASKVDPAGAKLIMDQYKIDSKQGDSAIEAERKTYNAEKKLYGNLITSYKRAESDSARLKNAADQFNLMLEQKKAALAEKKRHAQAGEKFDYDELAIKALEKVLDNYTKKQIAADNNKGRIIAQIAAKDKEYTDEGMRFIKETGGVFNNAANAGNVQGTVTSILDFLKPRGVTMEQRAEDRPQQLSTAEGDPNWRGQTKPELKKESEAAPKILPPVLTSAEKKKAAKAAKAGKSTGILDPAKQNEFDGFAKAGLVKKTINPNGTITYTEETGATHTFRSK